MENELLEYENKDNDENIKIDIIKENKIKISLIRELKEKDPKIEINIENKNRKINIR